MATTLPVTTSTIVGRLASSDLQVLTPNNLWDLLGDVDSSVLTSSPQINIDGSTLHFGFGPVAPTDGLVHIHSGTAGVVTANILADGLVIEGASSIGMSFLCPVTEASRILFGFPGSDADGAFTYDNTLQKLTITTGTDSIVNISLTSGFVFNDQGISTADFRVEGDTSTHLLFLDAGNERVGVSNASLIPSDGLVHIQSGSAGVVTASTSADTLVLEGSGTGGMQFLFPTTANIFFWSTAGGITDGQIIWDNALRTMRFASGTTINLSLAPAESVFNDGGLAGKDLRVESDTSTHAFFVDAGNNRVGISSASLLPTDGLLHIQSASAGTVTASAAADELVIEGSGDMGITMLAGSSSANIIYFGHSGSATAGRFSYQQGANLFTWHTESAEQMRLDSSGNLLLGSTFIAPASALGTLVISNDTSPTAVAANAIALGSKDSGAGSLLAVAELWIEEPPEVIGTFTASHKFKIWINGTEYFIQLDAV